MHIIETHAGNDVDRCNERDTMSGQYAAVLTALLGGSAGLTAETHAVRYIGAMTSTDTVFVAAPTGENSIDRASILAALERLQPGGTVQFAPGTYLVGEMIRVTEPRVTLLGHADGTTLRGCDPEDRADMETSMELCNGLELAGARQTVRGLTFEHAFWALHLGCCYEERASYDFPDGTSQELPLVRPTEGGHLIEGNTFRSNSSGIRVNGGWTEPSIVRGNRFIDNWHAVSINGHTVHVLENHFSVPQPDRVPNFGYPWDAIKIAPPMPLQGETGPPACIGNVVAGNTIEGYLDGIRVEVYLPGSVCRENVIRDNTITVRRAHNPSGVHFRDGGDPSDSTVIGVPIALLNDPIFSEYAGSDAPGVVEANLVEGNRILGAEGIGIEVLRSSRNRIVNNVIEGIVVREPFPGNTMAGAPNAWRDANGSAIWISAGSDGNEILGNTIEDVASHAVVIEGDSNHVTTRGAIDAVRDLGSGNRVEQAPNPSGHVDTRGIRLHYLDFGGAGLHDWYEDAYSCVRDFVDEAAAVVSRMASRCSRSRLRLAQTAAARTSVMTPRLCTVDRW
jgi:parallel beta-helix repeat protein